MPEPKTLGGVVQLGRFLYVLGGHDGAATTGTVFRAMVLDPLQAPTIDDIGVVRGAGAGIGAGVWYYRVSAVMESDDSSNPGGETLPSEPLVVSLPDAIIDTVILTLSWTPVDGAAGYRVYRSPTAGLAAGNELLLAEVSGAPTTTYTDDTATPAGASPLALGATGVWVEVSSLAVARQSPGVAIAHDPDDASSYFIYAVGGRDAGGALLASEEHAMVTVNGDGSQSLGSWTVGSSTLADPRAELGLFAVTNSEAAVVASGTTVMYAGGGDGSTDVNAAFVEADGDLSAWVAVDAMSPPRQGYAAIAGAGFLLAFGGQGGNPSDGGVSAELDTPAGADPPPLINWNNEGERLIDARYFAGAVRESAFIFLVGGQGEAGLLASTERTVL